MGDNFYKLPPLDCLNLPQYSQKTQSRESWAFAQRLEEILLDYHINGTVIDIEPGPIFTQYVLELAQGEKIRRLQQIIDDLKRALGVETVSITHNIPGTKAIGILIPNKEPYFVSGRSLLDSTPSLSNLGFAIGKTINNESFIFDMGKSGHLLIGGSTGSGKSIFIHFFIISCLLKFNPEDLKLILIDMKRVELSSYRALKNYHLITGIDEDIITSEKSALHMFNSLVEETERRFQVFADAGVRNISEYQEKQMEDQSLEKIPFIIPIVDEFGDLMMSSRGAVEEPIVRLAQKARAVGIHLILATQRPSSEVITGLIKANFLNRCSFKVASGVDSRIILDQSGAEKLIGNGDMLFQGAGTSIPIRLQAPIIQGDEAGNVLRHINSQPKPQKYELPFQQQINMEIHDMESKIKDPSNSDTANPNVSKSIYDHHFSDKPETSKINMSSLISILAIGVIIPLLVYITINFNSQKLESDVTSEEKKNSTANSTESDMDKSKMKDVQKHSEKDITVAGTDHTMAKSNTSSIGDKAKEPKKVKADAKSTGSVSDSRQADLMQMHIRLYELLLRNQ